MNVISDPESVAESNFMLTHGMATRAQWAEGQRHRDESDRVHALTEPYEAEVAGGTAKDRLGAFVAWRNRTARELEALQAKRDRLLAAVDAPAAVQVKRQGLLQMLARKLMGGDDITDADLADTGSIDASLGAATARAEAAKIAVAAMDKDIEAKTLGLKRLRERQRGFVQKAMLQHVAETYGNRYRDTVENLRALTLPGTSGSPLPIGWQAGSACKDACRLR
jgi:hypothetical protein